jgi:hypothetical protein
MQTVRKSVLLGVILLLAPALARGQAAPASPAAVGEVVPVVSLLAADPGPRPTPAVPDAIPEARGGPEVKFDGTYLPGKTGRDVDMLDLELTSIWNFSPGLGPLKVTPYLAAHFWNFREWSPTMELYDLNVECAWRPRLAEWLFADLAVTPGLYTDFKTITGESFQWRGRALGIVAFSERFQVVAGALYVNRNQTQVLPAGGVIWKPGADTRLLLVFPQPRVSQRLLTVGDTCLWGYVAGEFGGGRWAVERGRGETVLLDYTDWRVLVGLETEGGGWLTGHLEVGYTFNRRLNFDPAAMAATLPETVMVRAGLRF